MDREQKKAELLARYDDFYASMTEDEQKLLYDAIAERMRDAISSRREKLQTSREVAKGKGFTLNRIAG